MTALSIETALASFGVTDETLTAQERAALDHDGFVVLRGVFDDALCDRLREIFERRYLPSDRWPMPRGHDTRHSMLNDEPQIQLACLKPAILASVRHLLRRRFYLDDVQGRDPKPGGGLQSLHRDWVAPQGPAPMVIALAFLDRFGPANGATRLIPGSHLLAGGADAYAALDEHPGQIVVEGEGGDVLMMDGYLVHGGLRNESGRPRRNLQICFRGHEMQASQAGTRDAGDAPPALRYLLGQDI